MSLSMELRVLFGSSCEHLFVLIAFFLMLDFECFKNGLLVAAQATNEKRLAKSDLKVVLMTLSGDCNNYEKY